MTDRTAVSDVMANLLLLAVTVIFAVGFGALLVNLPPPLPSNQAHIESFILPTAPDRLVVEHRGGVQVPLSELVVIVDLGQTVTRHNVGQRLAASDPAWSVVAADGSVRSASASFLPGDQVRFTSPTLQGPTVRVSVVHRGQNAVLQDASSLRDADTTRPTLLAARTTSTTTLQLTVSEALAVVAATDFTISGTTISTARLLGSGNVVELVTGGLGTGATPTVATIASPAGTRDLSSNLLTGSQSVVAVDRTPPTIANVAATSTDAQITVTFTTSETATPIVQYGPTSLLGLSATASAGTSHAVALTALTAGTTYYYKVVATDAAGNVQTAEALRSQATTGSAGGGGGSTSGANHLEFTTVPSLLNPGILSTTITVTHRNAAGAAANPASPLVVRLATNSTAGSFRHATTGALITNVTIPATASTATFRYVDNRPYGPSVLTATATNTVSATAVVPVARRGILPSQGDSVASLVANVVYVSEQDRNEANVFLGVSIWNPTPTARTIDRVTLSVSPGLGTGTGVFFRSPSVQSSSDSEFIGCTLTGAGSDAITCDPTDFVLPAYAQRQLILTFTTSDSSTGANVQLSATFALAGGAGTVSATPVSVRHVSNNGQATMSKMMALTGSGGGRRAGFTGVTGGAPHDFHFIWNTEIGTLSSSTRIHIPAGWSAVSVPSGQAALASMTIAIRQPTHDAGGWVDVGQSGPAANAPRELAVRATPPAFTGLDNLHVEYVADPQSTAKPYVVNTYDFGVSVS